MLVEVDMKLGELEIGTEISIELKMGQKSWTFNQAVEQIVKGVVITSPLIFEGKVLDLSTGDASITVFASVGGEVPLQFRSCTAKLVQGKEKKYCAIACNNEGKRINRRGNFRVFIGERGVVELSGKSDTKLEVTVKDLSLMGVAFVVDKVKWEKDATYLWLDFQGRYGERMRIQASVVHCTEVENNLLIIGCRILKCANDLSTYITSKQRESLKKISGKS